jgi:hypothetical protein
MKCLCRLPMLDWTIRLEWDWSNFWIGCRWQNMYRLDVWVCLVPWLTLHYTSPLEGSAYDRGWNAADAGICTGEDPESLLNAARDDLDPDEFTQRWKARCKLEVKRKGE